MTSQETRALAAHRAVVSLCPVTEANLGDGVFNAIVFFEHGGRAAVGTDSNVQISLNGELRMMEYSQRLARRARNVLTQPGASTARALVDGAYRAGGAALGRTDAGLSVGADADIVTLRGDALDWLGGDPDTCLDAWVFTDAVQVDCVYARGRLVVEQGAHVARDAIRAQFFGAMRQLLAN
jgi:cytosine/adenosine deaminase-related metal-dependent hydrolase